MKTKHKLIATSGLIKNNRIVKVKPKMIILKALGGYTDGQLENAEKITYALREFCLKSGGLLILPNNDKGLDFIAQEDLEELVKQLP